MLTGGKDNMDTPEGYSSMPAMFQPRFNGNSSLNVTLSPGENGD